MSIPACRLKRSIARCWVLWGPTLANDSSPGFVRAPATSSASARYGEALLTTSTSGEVTSLQIGSKLVSGSKLTLRKSALTIMPLVLMRSVLPSGAARATASAAITPPPPGRLSMIIVCPRVRAISSARMRTSESMAPPAGTDTTIRIVRAACAHAEGVEAATAITSTATVVAIVALNRLVRLKILDAQRIDDVPELAAILVEDQLAVGGRGGPRAPRDLALELPRCPAGIAEHDQALLRPLAGADVFQDIEAHGDRPAGV